MGEQPWTGTELQQAMDLCIGCKGCKRECPNGVDMSLLKTETLAQRWQHSTMPWRDRWFAYLPMRMAWLRRFRGLIGLGRIPLVA
ncbi:4Fe-4S dicluster domain-containing protein, partial [Escherichia coli]